MNILIFCLTTWACYGIISWAVKKFTKIEIEERKQEIQEVEEQYENVMNFKKEHGKKLNKKEEVVEDFLNKEN